MEGSNLRQVRLRWTGEDLAFEGGPDRGVTAVIDSDGSRGLTPMESLLMAVAGCMAVDVLMILEKSRVPVSGLEVESIGERAETVPKRFIHLKLIYRVEGPGPEHGEKLDRAIRLSREKYCSVLHTLDPELDVDILVETA